MSKKTIDTLISDVHSLLQDGKFFVENERGAELLKEYGANVAQCLSDSLRQSSEPREPKLRLSAVGKPARKLFYEFRKETPKEVMTGKTLFKFQYGHMLEELFLVLAELAGHTVEHQQKEVEVDGVKGHIDAIIDGVLVDVKSASPFSFRKFVTGGFIQDDAFGYIPQLAAYRQALGGIPAAFIVIEKVMGDIALVPVEDKILDSVDLSDRIRIQRKVSDLDNPRVPPRCYDDKPEGKGGNTVLATGCSYCPFKQHCWRDANGGRGLRVFGYSNGPKFFTKVIKEPRVFELEAPPTVKGT